jgi:hypothetical protein
LEGLLLQRAEASNTALLDSVLTKVGNVLQVVRVKLGSRLLVFRRLGNRGQWVTLK